MLSDKQKMALKLGEAIRNICCMDSLANRYFEDHLRQKVREICDEQMHILGYESLTEHRERINRIFCDQELCNSMSDQEWKKATKYRKLKD